MVVLHALNRKNERQGDAALHPLHSQDVVRYGRFPPRITDDTSARRIIYPLERRKLPPEPIESNHCWDL